MKIAIIILAILLVSCKPKTNQEKLIGVWTIEEFCVRPDDNENVDEEILNLMVEFTNDSLFLISKDSIEYRTTWRVNKDSINIDLKTFENYDDVLSVIITNIDEESIELKSIINPICVTKLSRK